MNKVQPGLRFSLVFIISLLITNSSSAKPLQGVVQEKVDLNIVDKIREEGLKRSQIPDNARYLMDVIGPRLTGSPAMKRANEWTAGKMREYGLENVHLEPWEFGRGWEEVSYFGRMTEPFVKPLSGRCLAWTGSTKGLRMGPAVIVKAESQEDLAKYKGKLKGAWILVDEAGEPREPDFEPEPLRSPLKKLLAPPDTSEQQPLYAEEDVRQVIEEIRRHLELQHKTRTSGVLGILRRSSRTDGIIRGSSVMGDMVGSLIKAGEPEVLPNIMLADEDYSLIYRNVARGISVALEFNIQNRFHEQDLMAYNTIGEIPGTHKREEVVMLGAHLDSWHMGTGGTDNGAGSIIMLEAVRILKAIGAQTRRTIRIALWSGEEPEPWNSEKPVAPGGGKQGSWAYVHDHEDELDKISIYLNLDNGTGRIRGIWSQMNPHAVPIFEQILFPFRDLGVVAVRHGNTGGTDHVSFDQKGVPGFNFIQDQIEYWSKTHHSNVDTYDALLLDDMKQAAVVVASTVYHLAIRDEMFPRKMSTVEASKY